MDQRQMLTVFAVVAAVIVVGTVGFLLSRKRRSQRLRERFGPEYDRVVKKEGEVRRAEGVLAIRAQRRDQFQIRTLSPSLHDEFNRRWREVQSRFVDDPKGSVSQADQLVNEVMEARGYPTSDFEQRASDLSVDHPVVVGNYRAAHEIALRHGQGKASTEDLRKAMVHYRSLFDELLGVAVPVRKEARA